LGGWLRLVLRDVFRQYRSQEDGRLTVPAAVAALGAREQRVYRLGTHTSGRRAIAQALGLSAAEVAEAQLKIRQALQPTSKDWWTLETWQGDPALGPCPQAEALVAASERRLAPAEVEALAAHVATCPACRENGAFLEEAQREGGIAPPVAAPPWVNRAVLDASVSDAPEPTAAGDSWQRKALSQPDWLLGVTVGSLATVLVLLVLMPRLEYAKAVREPGDVAIARASQPLSAPVAAQLSDARVQLAKARLDPAIQNLKAVLAQRPDNQEARWLLATTYDRMGDQIQAAQQYKIFLDTEKREQAFVDDRVRRAQDRLEAWEETP
jgi:cytochrome c-type biogenesis protein CcmH/NrfG